MKFALDAKAMTALCLHGAGGGAWEWNIWRRVFAAHGRNMCASDLQPAAAGVAATQLDDYAEQVVAHSREASPSVLIGASLGGLLAMMTAPRIAPRALVLINPLPPADVSPALALRDYPDVVHWGSRRSLASTQRAMPDADDAARLYALRRWRDESGAVLREACAGVAVARPQCPTLVLASEHDADVPPRGSRALADYCGAEFHLLHGASHVGPLLGRAAPDAAKLVLDWLARVLRDTG